MAFPVIGCFFDGANNLTEKFLLCIRQDQIISDKTLNSMVRIAVQIEQYKFNNFKNKLNFCQPSSGSYLR